MNLLKRIITYVPTLQIYLKGTLHFNNKDFESASNKFKKCLDHKNFQNELVYSYYGQSLLAMNKLEESYPFLVQAYDIYENQGWKIKNDVSKEVAFRTISALIHIKEGA